MSRGTALFTGAALLIGAGCTSESSAELERNPLAMNVAIEHELRENEFSKEFLAGLSLGIAEECVILGIAESEIEEVPVELQNAEFYRAYGIVINGGLSTNAIIDMCMNANQRMQLTV